MEKRLGYYNVWLKNVFLHCKTKCGTVKFNQTDYYVRGLMTVLKGIPSLLSPELLKILMEMGHGDEIVLGDGNFPAASNTQRLVRCSGIGVPKMLDAIMKLLPLDTFVKSPVILMSVVSGDPIVPTIWDEYKKIFGRYDARSLEFEYLDRNAFYERTRKAYAVIATSESARYANIILKKGIIDE
jgi:L-fucose mutarotase